MRSQIQAHLQKEMREETAALLNTTALLPGTFLEEEEADLFMFTICTFSVGERPLGMTWERQTSAFS